MDGSEWVHTSTAYVKPRSGGRGDAWSEEAASRGRRGTQRIVRAGEIAAPEGVAALLGLSEGAAVVERRRVILLDGAPVELTDTYYPASFARGTRLAETGKIPGGAVTLVASLGRTGCRVREEIRARLPTPSECEVLALTARDPVLHLTRVTLDAGNEPFQVDVSVFPAATQRLRYEMRIG
ncbi:GntR family transcriptional regulator [Streptomyces sp. NPDC092296]|uniref:GntR family transcriptional regulator n=1 Tax=Streptomyces sp. NPDC092296 TaxID=3366012 RepID=UPI0037FA6F0E